MHKLILIYGEAFFSFSFFLFSSSTAVTNIFIQIDPYNTKFYKLDIVQ